MTSVDQFMAICAGLFVMFLLVGSEQTPHDRAQRIVLALLCGFWISSVITRFLLNG